MRTENIHIIKQMKLKCRMLEEQEKKMSREREELEKIAIESTP
jgi:hypothetical protein